MFTTPRSARQRRSVAATPRTPLSVSALTAATPPASTSLTTSALGYSEGPTNNTTTTSSLNLTDSVMSYTDNTTLNMSGSVGVGSVSGGGGGSLPPTRVLNSTDRHVIEVFAPLPPAVVAALGESSAHGPPGLVGSIGDDGVAFLVLASRVCLWRCVQSTPSDAYTLAAPGSFNSCTANLVAPIPMGGAAYGCVVGSREGFVRFFPDITAQPYRDVDLGLEGEVSLEMICAVRSDAVVAITSDSTMYIVGVGVAGGQPTLSVATTSRSGASEGVLAKLGASMGLSQIWGYSDTASGAPPVRTLVGGTLNDGRRELHLLTERCLEKWAVGRDAAELVYQFPLLERATQRLVDMEMTVSNTAGGLRVWLLDVAYTADGGVTVLTASVPDDVPADMVPLLSYTLLTLSGVSGEGDGSHVRIDTSSTLDFDADFEEDNTELLTARIALPSGGPAACVYVPSCVLLTLIPTDERPLDSIPLPDPNQQVVAAGVTGERVLFVSPALGVVAVSQLNVNSYVGGASGVGSGLPVGGSAGEDGDTAMADINALLSNAAEEASNKPVSLLRELDVPVPAALESAYTAVATAFTLYSVGEEGECANALAHVYSGGVGRDQLQAALVYVSECVVDAVPASDPRWAEDGAGDAFAAGSLINGHLAAKRRKHNRLLNFITATELWDRTTLATRNALLDHGSKLDAATALRGLQNDRLADRSDGGLAEEIMSQAVAKVHAARPESEANAARYRSVGLGPSDLFYAKVSRIEEVLSGLRSVQEGVLSARGDAMGVQRAQRQRTVVGMVNAAFAAVLSAGATYRRNHMSAYRVSLDAQDGGRVGLIVAPPLPNTPWYSTQSVRSALAAQIATSHAAFDDQSAGGPANQPGSQSSESAAHFPLLVTLTETLLDSFVSELAALATVPSTPPLEEYATNLRRHLEHSRSVTLAAFVRSGRYRDAYALAEKFQDFTTLVALCEETGDLKRLDRYLTQFRDEGFAEFVFEWYLSNGLRTKLLRHGETHPEELTAFLVNHPRIAWVHSLYTGDYVSAATNTFEEAAEETDSLARRKTLLCLGKIAAWAAGGPPNMVTAFDAELYSVRAQETLLSGPEDAPALSPPELIQALVREGTADRLVLALEVLDNCSGTLSAEECMALYHGVWRVAICADDWLGVAREMESAGFSDTVLETFIRRSVMYAVAVTYNGDQWQVNANTVAAVEASVEGYNSPSVERVLKSALMIATRDAVSESGSEVVPLVDGDGDLSMSDGM